MTEADGKGQAEQFSAAAGEAQNETSEAAQSMKSQARDFAEQQKATSAAQIGDVANAMHEAADDLHQKIPLAADYVTEVAGRLDGFASTLREKSVDQMVGNVTDFARKQLAMFFAGTVAAGFALSRFLKSSGSKG